MGARSRSGKGVLRLSNAGFIEHKGADGLRQGRIGLPQHCTRGRIAENRLEGTRPRVEIQGATQPGSDRQGVAEPQCHIPLRAIVGDDDSGVN